MYIIIHRVHIKNLFSTGVSYGYANLFFDNNDLNLLVNSSTTIRLTLT